MGPLGGFSEDALNLFQLAASESSYEFTEGEDMYDFTRCVRSDGTAYGTGGRCVKGSQEDKAPVAPAPPKGKMTKKDSVANVLRTQKETSDLMKKVGAEQMRNNPALRKEVEEMRARQEKLKAAQEGGTPGMAARIKAAKEKLAAEKKANGGKRTDRIQEEKRLAQNRAQRERDAKVKANQKKQAEMDARNK
jgi:hypothetical protein